ncbi:PRC-barrel domain-containing protein [Ancylobacter polymorphus]|uniref:PRC-barrel domain-containing protein n=1 Tax=Ancylobacter polymorphus TaxID=223390 RepID=A0A9E7D295_9HYPH|nr:PRC-barrel domain-containing protein [Ancylobacter polymorphus]UOK69742.1 PRC-barrel domain-containing protein [Ancylobacter polymorphus]
MQTTQQNVDARETRTLIGSDKVEGTAVYRPNGERIGTIERVMIDKLTGQTAYAVMSFGGFLGFGEDYYPLPWSLLKYDERLDGYVVDISEEQLQGAPHHATSDERSWQDRDWGRKVDDYYNVPPYVI